MLRVRCRFRPRRPGRVRHALRRAARVAGFRLVPACPKDSLALGTIFRVWVLSLRARRSDSAFPRLCPPGSLTMSHSEKVRPFMARTRKKPAAAPAGVEVTYAPVQVVARAAAIDVAKGSGMVCTRLPSDTRAGRRTQRVWHVPSSFATPMAAVAPSRAATTSTGGPPAPDEAGITRNTCALRRPVAPAPSPPARRLPRGGRAPPSGTAAPARAHHRPRSLSRPAAVAAGGGHPPGPEGCPPSLVILGKDAQSPESPPIEPCCLSRAFITCCVNNASRYHGMCAAILLGQGHRSHLAPEAVTEA